MTRMFCTQKEAAGWLGVTEPEVKKMLTEGVLREFRDGANQFLRIADVRAFAASQSPDDLIPPRPTPQTPTKSRPTQRATQGHGVSTGESKDILIERCLTPACQQPHGQPLDQTIGNAPWPCLQDQRLSVWRSFWIGVAEDRPSAILAMTVLVALVLSALAGSAYVLLRIS